VIDNKTLIKVGMVSVENSARSKTQKKVKTQNEDLIFNQKDLLKKCI
jgi:hypothetical protein